MYRFALRPTWILSHLLIVLLVVVMVNLGFWQLRRLDQKKDFNRLVSGREAAAVSPLDDVLEPTESFAQAASAATYRRVTVSGHYDTANEVVVRARSLNENPGAWVLTPLVTSSGAAVLVNRGWFGDPGVPEHAPAAAAPPEGAITVTGMLLPTETRGLFGSKDPTTGHLTNLARADVARVQQQVPYDLYPATLQLSAQQPPQPGSVPVELAPPVLDEGPHFSYAVQWFMFSAIAVVGYPLILRRTARNRTEQARNAERDAAGSGDAQRAADSPTAPVATPASVDRVAEPATAEPAGMPASGAPAIVVPTTSAPAPPDSSTTSASPTRSASSAG
jgi:cytochrome oxidase assembly protein ShyY1